MNLDSFLIRPPAPAMLSCLLCLTAIGATAAPSARAQAMGVTFAGTDTTDTDNNVDPKEAATKESRSGYYVAAAVGLGLGLSQWNATRASYNRSSLANGASAAVSSSAVGGRLYELPFKLPLAPDGNVFVPSKQGSVTVTSFLPSLLSTTVGSSDIEKGVSSSISQRSDASGSRSNGAKSAEGETIVSDVSLSTGTGAVPDRALALSPLRVYSLLLPGGEEREQGPTASAGRATGSTGAAAITAVPEPGEWATMGLAGMSVMGLMVRARRCRASKNSKIAA